MLSVLVDSELPATANSPEIGGFLEYTSMVVIVVALAPSFVLTVWMLCVLSSM